MTLKLETIVEDVLRRAEGQSRFIIAIAGPPGAGKSTLADALCDALRARGETAAVLPMDGFHMDNGILEERGLLSRKGAPETFDVRGFLDIVSAVLEGGQEVLVPVFDRSREIAIASAHGRCFPGVSISPFLWVHPSRCLKRGCATDGRAMGSMPLKSTPNCLKTIFPTEKG
jgi:pantothenate kinase-related protein Tda10